MARKQKTIFHSSSCSTCREILKSMNLDASWELVDIKKEGISSRNIQQMKNLSGTYESLFSRRSLKYRSLGLAEKSLTEADYKKLMLSEYTFLKRPVVIYGDAIFVGSTKSNKEALKTLK